MPIGGFGLNTVRHIEAQGGGDYPESLNQALHEALTDTSWRPLSVKLVFLLADAPPHLDYPQDEDYAREMARAQNTATKIFAVASSGLDAQGEYIFRQLAQQTMGKFVFILYESGAQGQLTTSHEVGDDYSVENLDRLIVRLIAEEMAPLAAPRAASTDISPHRAAQVSAALRLAASHVGAPPDQMSLRSVDETIWSNGALGCPQPGYAYTAAEEPGLALTFSHPGVTVRIHTSDRVNRAVVAENCD